MKKTSTATKLRANTLDTLYKYLDDVQANIDSLEAEKLGIKGSIARIEAMKLEV